MLDSKRLVNLLASEDATLLVNVLPKNPQEQMTPGQKPRPRYTTKTG